MAGEFCFTLLAGKDIYLYKLRNEHGAEAWISNYGGILQRYRIPMADGSLNDIVLGLERIEDYRSQNYLANYPYFGASIGRYANRIPGGKFHIGEKEISLSKNENGNFLHGGFEGFDKKAWEFIHLDEDCNILELRYQSPDGEEGFPGNLDVTLNIELNDDNDLLYTYTATTDEATAINLSHHSYFNLGNGQGLLSDHALKIYAEKILRKDDHKITTGEEIAVRNTRYDFREFHALDGITDEEKSFDMSFDLGKNANVFSIAAELMYKPSGLKLQLLTTEPVLHLYTGAALPVIKGKDGKNYGPFSGIAVETHRHPNAVNIEKFPGTILLPGEKYLHRTAYKICAPVPPAEK
jgi:aldose 1-epimerase